MYIVFNKPIGLENSEGVRVCHHGESTGISAAWCRELAVSKVERFLSDIPPEELAETTATIFGVCSHAHNTTYEKSGWTKEYKGNPILDQIMLQWFKYTVLLCIQVNLGISPSYNILLSRQTLPKEVGMWQNAPPECIQELVGEIGPEKTDGRGGIYGIPASLLKSPSIFSLLLYLPRLCESLNRNRSRLWKLRELTGSCKYRYQFPRAFEPIFKSFAMPTSFTRFGRAEFWTMYYLLSRAPKNSKWIFDERLHGKSGFCSGIQTLFRFKSFPEDVKQFYLDYKNNGFHTLVNLREITY